MADAPNFEQFDQPTQGTDQGPGEETLSQFDVNPQQDNNTGMLAQTISAGTPSIARGSPFQSRTPLGTPEARGEAFEQNLSPAWGAEEAFTSGVSQGAVGNLTERLDAATAAGANWLMGGNLKQSYADKLAENTAYVNALQRDYPMTTLGGQVLGLIGTANAIGGAWEGLSAPTSIGTPLLKRMAISGGQSGILGAWQGFASGNGWRDRIEQAKNMILPSFLLGAGGEAVLSGIGSAYNKVFGTSRIPGADIMADALKQAGGDQEKAQQIAQQMVAERAQQAEQFGLKLTAGQANLNPGQQAFEQGALRGEYGEPARDILELRQAQNESAIEEAKGAIIPKTSTINDLGDSVQKAINDRADFAKNMAQSYYKSADITGTKLTPDAIANLGRNLSSDLEANGVPLNQGLEGLPGSKQAMNLINKRLLEGENPLSLSSIDDTRKLLMGLKASNPTDQHVLRIISRGFNNWFGDAATHDLFSGDPEGFEFLKQGRAAASDYLSLLDPHEALGQLVKEGVGADQVSNWMTNATTVNQTNKAVQLAQAFKGYFGENAPEWQALRESVWDKFSAADTPGRLASSVNKLTDGVGAPLARELYSDPELDTMRMFAKSLRMTIPDPNAVNRSHTAYELFRRLGEAIPLPSVFGFGAGAAEGYAEDHDYVTAVSHGLIGMLGGMALEKINPARIAAKSALKALPGAVPTGRVAPMLGTLLAKQGYLSGMTPTIGFPKMKRGGAVDRAVRLARSR